jgi:hypothetical protein
VLFLLLYATSLFIGKARVFLCFLLKNSLLAFSSARLIATTTEKRTGTDEKAEIVPEAIVVDFVNTNRIAKPGDDKSEYRDEAVPEPAPKTGNTSLWRGHTLHRICSGCATYQSYQSQQQNPSHNAFHFFLQFCTIKTIVAALDIKKQGFNLSATPLFRSLPLVVLNHSRVFQ